MRWSAENSISWPSFGERLLPEPVRLTAGRGRSQAPLYRCSDVVPFRDKASGCSPDTEFASRGAVPDRVFGQGVRARKERGKEASLLGRDEHRNDLTDAINVLRVRAAVMGRNPKESDKRLLSQLRSAIERFEEDDVETLKRSRPRTCSGSSARDQIASIFDEVDAYTRGCSPLFRCGSAGSRQQSKTPVEMMHRFLEACLDLWAYLGSGNADGAWSFMCSFGRVARTEQERTF